MVVRGLWMKVASVNRRAAWNTLGWMIILFAAFMVGLWVGSLKYQRYYTDGFKAAFFAYKCGCLECEVKKHHPEWLNDEK